MQAEARAQDDLRRITPRDTSGTGFGGGDGEEMSKRPMTDIEREVCWFD